MGMFTCGHCREVFKSTPGVDDIVFCPHCNEIVSLPESDVELAAGTVLGGFQIIKLLGKGGMGNVYLATQLSMQRPVALKVLPKTLTRDADAVVKFLGEVKNTGRLQHQHIVTAIDAGEDKGSYFLAMQYVDGETLEDKIDREGTIPEDEALEYALMIAEALQYAWGKRGLFHKDIKPGNIMVTESGDALLLDMGIAQRIGDAAESDGHIEGSPFYMSPEQSRAEKLSWSTDVYSLGASLYHMVVGVPPFDHQDIMRIVEMHTTEPFPEPQARKPGSKVHPKVVELLKRMLGKTPKDRFKSWADFEKAAKAVLKELRKKTPPAKAFGKKFKSPSGTSRKSKGKSPIVSIIVAVNTLAMLGVALYFAYYFLGENNTANARNAFESAENYVRKPNFNYDEALQLYSAALNLSNKFAVKEDLKKRISTGYSNFKTLADARAKERMAFEKAYQSSAAKLAEAKELLSLGNDLVKERKDDGGNYAKASASVKESMQALLSAVSSDPGEEQQLTQLRLMIESLSKQVEGAAFRKEKLVEAVRKEEIKKERTAGKVAEYKADLSKRKDSMRLKLLLNSKKRDYGSARKAATIPTEGDSVGADDPALKPDAEAFDKWSAFMRSHVDRAESLWRSLIDSGTKFAGETVMLDGKEGKVSGIEADEIKINMGSAVEKLPLAELSGKDMLNVVKKAAASAGGDQALFSFLMSGGDFEAASSLSADGDSKKELSEMARVYIKARMLKAIKDQKLGKTGGLERLKAEYGSLPEYKAAEKEVGSGSD